MIEIGFMLLLFGLIGTIRYDCETPSDLRHGFRWKDGFLLAMLFGAFLGVLGLLQWAVHHLP